MSRQVGHRFDYWSGCLTREQISLLEDSLTEDVDILSIGRLEVKSLVALSTVPRDLALEAMDVIPAENDGEVVAPELVIDS